MEGQKSDPMEGLRKLHDALARGLPIPPLPHVPLEEANTELAQAGHRDMSAKLPRERRTTPSLDSDGDGLWKGLPSRTANEWWHDN